MIAWMAMELVPLLYGAAYLLHSFHRHRYGQACAVGVLLLLALGATGVLLWEFFAVP